MQSLSGRFWRSNCADDNTASLLPVSVSILCRGVMTLPHYTDVEERDVKQLADEADARWNAARTEA